MPRHGIISRLHLAYIYINYNIIIYEWDNVENVGLKCTQYTVFSTNTKIIIVKKKLNEFL